MTDCSDKIEEGHGSCLCPLCDNEIEAFDTFKVVTAHGSKYLVHSVCLEDEGDD